MTPKNILTLIGALIGLQGIGLFLGAEAITKFEWDPGYFVLLCMSKVGLVRNLRA